MSIVMPVPASAGKPPCSFKGRVRTKQWAYRNAEGEIFGYVQRYDYPGGKDVVPVTYWRDADGEGWRFKGFPEPRPLYGLDHLAAAPDASVLVCEGEKATAAARKLAPNWTCITSSGGAQSARKTDWSPINGRRVVIWPDADEAGTGYAHDVAKLALAAGATSVGILDLQQLSKRRGQGKLPAGYDAADAREEGSWFDPAFLEDDTMLVPFEPPATHGGTDGDTDAPSDIPEGAVLIDTGDLYEAARELLEAVWSVDGQPMYRRWAGSWYSWTGTAYAEVSDEQMRSVVYQALSVCWTHDRQGEPTRVRPTPRMVDGLLDALAGRTQVNIPSMPAWLGDAEGRPKARNVVAFVNGLLDSRMLQQDKDVKLLPHTPSWFSLNVLPYDFDPEAQCPNWVQFLETVSGGDKGWIKALRRIFGYLLTTDTRDQKIIWFIGPPRSGKGTILRVIQRIVGRHNVCAPTLASLGTPFGLQALLGKTVVLCGEVHLGGRTDRAAVVEVLKKISGEDAVDINRKFKDPLTNVRLPARFVLAANEPPSLPDVSGALAARSLIMPFSRSFEGQEDTELDRKLAAETAGICQWALVGLLKYQEEGRLMQPASGKAAVDEFRLLGSPVKAWWAECVDEKGLMGVPCDLAYRSWRQYCQDFGHEPGSSATFGAKLKSAFPRICRERDDRPDASGKRVWRYVGFSLTRDAQRRATG